MAVCPPGLERILGEELNSLGIRGRPIEGGVLFVGGFREMALANLWLRVASRILLRLARFKAETFAQLEKKVERLPWEKFVPEGFGVRVRVTSYRSRLYHEGAIRERFLRVISRRLGRDLSIAKEGEALVVVRFVKDLCTVSIDTSGGDLFRRGYKEAKGPAALRENLAAALVLASGWDRLSPLLDPFCGTGTIPVEAAMIAARRAPGLNRTFPFESWPEFDRALFEELKEEARQKEVPPPQRPFIFAADASEEMTEATKANLKAAELAGWVEVFKAELKELRPPSPSRGFLVTDPPYGRRLRSKELSKLYRELGRTVRERFYGWQVVLIFPREKVKTLENLTKLRFFPVLTTDHGGTPCSFLKVREGPSRRRGSRLQGPCEVQPDKAL